jgi:peptidyl-prolyl cis-trans isomerase C
MYKFWTNLFGLGISFFLFFGSLGQALCNDDEVLARVGNEAITRIDYETRLKSMPPGKRQEFEDFEKKKELLDNMIKARLLVVEGTNKGMMEKADLQAKLRAIRDDFITQEYVLAYIEKKVEVTEEETKAYYESSPEFRARDVVKMSQIVVEKEAEAKEILKSLKKGENFKKLAREKSADPVSKYQGGEVEWFEKGNEDKEIEEALLKLEKGGISDIVKAKGNYYILKLDDRKTIPQPPYLKVKDEILRNLKRKKLLEIVGEEIEDLKKKITIETFYDKLKTEK